MDNKTVDIHTQFRNKICSPLTSAIDSLNGASSILSNINIPTDFSKVEIDNANNEIPKIIISINDTLGDIDECVRNMDNAEVEILSLRYQTLQTELTKDVSTDIGGYSEEDGIDRQEVLMDAIEVTGVDNWARMDERAKKIILNAEYIHRYMEMKEHPYEYCVFGNNEFEEHSRDENDIKHGLDETFEESKQNKHNTCCATYVSWVLEDAGLLTRDEYREGADDLQDLLRKKGWQVIKNEEDLQPGDILGYKSHVEIYAGRDEEGNKNIYNAGSGDWVRVEGPISREKWKDPYEKDFVRAFRIPATDN